MLGVSLQLSDEERYKDCEHFTFTCPRCGTDNICDSVFEGTVSSERSRRSATGIIAKIGLLKNVQWEICELTSRSVTGVFGVKRCVRVRALLSRRIL